MTKSALVNGNIVQSCFTFLKVTCMKNRVFYDKTITIFEIKRILSIAEEIKHLLYNQVYLYMFHKFINK